MWRTFFFIFLTYGVFFQAGEAVGSCVTSKELGDLSVKLVKLISDKPGREETTNDLKAVIIEVERMVRKMTMNAHGGDGDGGEIGHTNIVYDGDNRKLSASKSVSRSSFLQALMIPKYRYLMSDDPNVSSANDRQVLKQFQAEFPSTTSSMLRPSDCSDLLITGERKSGVYTIYPFRCFCSPGIQVYCDMETSGGGWTVFLKRQNQTKQEDFKRTWDEYRNGFGSPPNEYWLGNEALFMMTNSREYSLRMDASIVSNGWNIWGEWANFKVFSENLKYKLSVTGFNSLSTMYDRQINHNGNYFSTVDRDNDKHKLNCASKYKGGGGYWYYTSCALQDLTHTYGSIKFTPWSRTDATARMASHVQMMIRPKICNEKISVANLNSHNCHTTSL